MITSFGLYLLKSTLVSGIFYLSYWLFFKKESFFLLSRFYLLSCLFFAYLFPFITLPVAEETIQAIPALSSFQITVNQFSFTEELPIPSSPNTQTAFNSLSLLWLLFGMITSLFLFRFIKHLIHIRKTITAHETIKKSNYTLVLINQKNTFSFFRYIFISPFVRNSPDGSHILAHELSHFKHLHSLDRLIVEVLNIAFWMNPFIYLYRKALEEVHEYQADRDANQTEHSLKNYFELVLRQASHSAHSPLMSPFSYQLIKKRILMSTHKSNPFKKFAIIVPILIGAVILTTSAISSEKKTQVRVNETVKKADENPKTGFIRPIDDDKVSRVIGWGYRVHPIHKVKKLHQGIDFKTELNTPVYASKAGIVSLVQTDKTGYGKRIELQHNNKYKTLYAHLNRFNVKVGQSVNQGDIIGYVGNTGASTAPHLHFEVHIDDKPVDPKGYLIQTTSTNPNLEQAYGGSLLFSSPIRNKDLKRIAAGYGYRIHPIHKTKQFHRGVDYSAPLNTVVLSVEEGTVRKVEQNFEEGKGYGRFIIIDHSNGFSSLYAMLNSYKVKEGDKVKKGDVIGLVGSSGISTGPHLHFEIKKDGQHADPSKLIDHEAVKM